MQDCTTVAAAFEQAARQWPAQPFLALLPETAEVYGLEPGELGYADCARRIADLRTRYAAQGYGQGHRVGLLLENRPDFLLHWFALNGLGVCVVPINAELRAAELEYLIDHAELVLVVALPSRHAALLAAAGAMGRQLRVMSADADMPEALTAVPDPLSPIDELSECALLYTSGTTGRPKACVLPNRYFLHAGRWYARLGGLCRLRPGQERMLTPLPLVHMNAMAYSTMAMLMTGGCLILLDRFHPSSWWHSVRAARASVVHYLGVMPALLMQAPYHPSDRDHGLRFGFGAGVDRALHLPFEQRFGFPLIEAWAMTETGAGAVVIANEEPRKAGTSCFGRPARDLLVRVIADDGQPAAPGQAGELQVRHAGADPRYGFFAGYLKDAEATAAAWADGWFHTGDIVRRDADGYLCFIDRRRNVIRRSGENISALEVESCLNAHPAVKSAAVAATPDPLRGDEVLACVVTREALDAPAQAALAARLVEHSLTRLAYFKAPGYIAFVDSLPLTASQKIQRAELHALARSLPGQACCVDTRAMKRRQA